MDYDNVSLVKHEDSCKETSKNMYESISSDNKNETLSTYSQLEGLNKIPSQNKLSKTDVYEGLQVQQDIYDNENPNRDRKYSMLNQANVYEILAAEEIELDVYDDIKEQTENYHFEGEKKAKTYMKWRTKRKWQLLVVLCTSVVIITAVVIAVVLTRREQQELVDVSHPSRQNTTSISKKTKSTTATTDGQFRTTNDVGWHTGRDIRAVETTPFYEEGTTELDPTTTTTPALV